MLFSVLWLTVVYAPLAHMVWSADGLLFAMGAIDFAGGTVVHINAGIAGLVGVLFAGPRNGQLEGSDAAALAGADDGRRGIAVGRLVRLQRRLGARGHAWPQWRCQSSSRRPPGAGLDGIERLV